MAMFVDVLINQHQSQTLAITTQAIESIKLLQLSAQDLQDYVAAQAESNPLLQVSPPPNIEISPYKHRDTMASRTAGDVADVWEYLASPVTLREQLLVQVSQAIGTLGDRRIADELVEAIDLDGYFRNHTADFAEYLGVDETDVLRVLRIIQGFEPTGVGARDLQECLSLQLEERGLLTTPMRRLLENLPLLARFELDKLAHRCGVDPDAIKAMSATIRQLCPAPGRKFDCERILPALPDILVRRTDDGAGFVVELNPDLLPRVLVDRTYYAEIGKSTKDTKDHHFLMGCYKSALWLTRSLDHRAQTLLRVATEIVTRQREFCEYGVGHLKPLDLKTLAAAIGIHESTVSRATANKYILTTHGLFEMRYFFSTAIKSNAEEGEIAAHTVQHRIKKIVANEKEPLSDDAIVTILDEAGIKIARRTVAKYRTILNIPSSSLRKRQTMMSLLT
jgi:RNA polymerase sigma-54 factor